MPNTPPGAIKALIVDDENKACINLKSLLLDYVDPELNIVGLANSTREAEEMAIKFTPDVLFLDIEMPNENAFGFLDRISPVPFEVIFVTAYDEYALRAFKLNAIDYILKPISIPELRNAYAKLKEKLSFKKMFAEQQMSYSELSEQVNNKAKSHKITLRGTNSLEVVDFSDILFVEAQSSYSRIVFFKNGVEKELLLSHPLSDYEELLPDNLFCRIHRSYLINTKQIKKLASDSTNQVMMNNGLQIPISRRRYSSLIEFLEVN